ncbi:hypothetical protein FRACYDRAFT_243070 [Fragilariopsis cylindrus CCMP1102]|uniref:Uncharacterized protein n=1 Tax=Fragilariopsis cylindrus CCMP1102 TaxID=635003 RepID=A0A1E7F4R9_9STRA|nr:hypothetical protein FRACYDRAFT_243070 [Fragilariopsis cylindrus CCMP1102]|eukprot:OEU13178.1 hypothetical protein FRACYDRAFT_243070 [Fragilariopsis cylindrus CCMP1102]
MTNFTFQPTPSYHDTNNSNYYEGNIQLMEARYLELCSSIRALYRSINDIREFITTNTNDNDKDGDDNKKNDDDNCNNDFIDAINENIILFNKQRFELYNIVNGMNNLNTKIMDVPDDIYIMVVDHDKDEDNNDATTTAISVTAAIADATINTAAAAAASTTITTTREDDNDDNSQQGFHL